MAWVASDRAFLLPKEDFGQSHADVTFGATHDASQEYRERERLVRELKVSPDDSGNIVGFSEVLDAFRARKGNFVVDEDRLQHLYACAGDRRQVTWPVLIDAIFRERRMILDSLASVQQSIRDTGEHIVHCERELKACINCTTAAPEDERLIIQVLFIKFLDEPPMDWDSRHYRISLECDGQSQETASRSKMDSQIFWNQIFNFKLAHPEGSLGLSLMAINPRSSDGDSIRFVARGALNLGMLADQSRHEVTVSMAGENLDIEVALVLQWLRSKVSFYEKHLHKYQEERASLLREEEHLIQEQIIFEKSILGTNSMLGREHGISPLTIMSAAVTHPEDFVNWTVERMMFSVNASDFDRAVQVMLMGFIALSCFGSFTRALYMDTMIGAAAFWCNLDAQRRWTVSKYSQILLALVVSGVFDCIWIFYNFRIIKVPDSGLAHVTKVMSLICICWKIVLFFFMAKCRYDTQAMNLGDRVLSGTNAMGKDTYMG